MKRIVSLITLASLILGLTVPSFARRHHKVVQPQDNGCSLKFKGKARKKVKLRATDLDYTLEKGGDPIAVSDFLDLVCPLNPQIPAKVPATKPMTIEKLTVTLRAFVLAMKRDPDNDLHIQIADSATPYKQPQIIVEIPPGSAYCDARSNMMDLLRADGGSGSGSHVFDDPPQVELTGYLFLDSTHGASCTKNGGRGIKNGLTASPVKGTWEIHPVIKLEKVE